MSSSMKYCHYLRNGFDFFKAYRSVNYIGSRAKGLNPEGIRVNFASDPM